MDMETDDDYSSAEGPIKRRPPKTSKAKAHADESDQAKKCDQAKMGAQAKKCNQAQKGDQWDKDALNEYVQKCDMVLENIRRMKEIGPPIVSPYVPPSKRGQQ